MPFAMNVQCTAQRKNGAGQCKKPAVKGATVCQTHGGAAPQVRAKAMVRAELMNWKLGDAVDDPGEVLLRLVTQARIRVDEYAAELQRLVDESPNLRDALVGDAQGEFGKVGEYVRGLAQLEANERDRLATFASKAVAAGLGERQVRLAERQGELVAILMTAIIQSKQLGLTEQQQQLMPVVIREQLALAQAGQLKTK